MHSCACAFMHVCGCTLVHALLHNLVRSCSCACIIAHTCACIIAHTCAVVRLCMHYCAIAYPCAVMPLCPCACTIAHNYAVMRLYIRALVHALLHKFMHVCRCTLVQNKKRRAGRAKKPCQSCLYDGYAQQNLTHLLSLSHLLSASRSRETSSSWLMPKFVQMQSMSSPSSRCHEATASVTRSKSSLST